MTCFVDLLLQRRVSQAFRIRVSSGRIGPCNGVHRHTARSQELTTDQLPWQLIRLGLPHSVLKKVINSSFCAGLKSLKL
jgi:hypothetical protein